MKEITRSQALRLTRKLYRELAKSGNTDKPNWTKQLCSRNISITKKKNKEII